MMGINKKIFAKVVTVVVVWGKSNVTGSVERGRLHFIVLWIDGVEVHLVGRILGHLGTVVMMAAVQGAAGTIWPSGLGGGGTPGIGGGFGPIDHCGVPWSVKSVLVIIVLRSRGLHEWRLGRPRWARRSCGRRLVIILWVKVKQTSSKTAVM